MKDKNTELMDEMELDRVTLTDEDGVEKDFDIIGTLELDGNTYVALIAAEDDTDEYVILKMIEENGEEIFITIADDDEFSRVANMFDEAMQA